MNGGLPHGPESADASESLHLHWLLQKQLILEVGG